MFTLDVHLFVGNAKMTETVNVGEPTEMFLVKQYRSFIIFGNPVKNIKVQHLFFFSKARNAHLFVQHYSYTKVIQIASKENTQR